MTANRRLFAAPAGVPAVVFAFVGSNVAANHEPKPHEPPGGLIARGRGARRPARAQARRGGSRGPDVRLPCRGRYGRDLVPLPAADSSGASAFSAMLSLIIAGVVETSVMLLVTRDRRLPVRLAAVMTLGIVAGLVAALATNVVVGAFAGHFLAVRDVWTLFVLALALPIAAFQALLGLGGSAISQLLPPGAATTAMRDVVDFHGQGATGELLVLAVYAVAGATGALAANAAGIGAAARNRSHHPTTPELPHVTA